MPNPESITIPRRLVGLGTMFLGTMALYFCVSYLDDLWDTPQRTVSIVVTGLSALIVFNGIVIGFPDLLPSKIVAGSMAFFGILIMLIGATTLVWFAYNVFVARQKEFRMGMPSFSVTMILVGFGITAKSISSLKKTD